MLLSILLPVFGACSHAYTVKVSPADAAVIVDGRIVHIGEEYRSPEADIRVSVSREGYEPYHGRYSLSGIFSVDEIVVNLTPRQYQVSIAVTEGVYRCLIDGIPAGITPFNGTLSFGDHRVTFFTAKGPALTVPIRVRREQAFLFRPQPAPLPIGQMGVFPCGEQPKQLLFSPNNRFLFITLLNGEGFQIFDMTSRAMRDTIRVGRWSGRKGFPEGLFVPAHGAFFVSQMSSDHIFEYGLHEDGSVEFRRALSSGGVFPKFMD
ncbi:MAG TPA: hypothetical protein ENN69_03425, partial [Spirochaetia bacterium]|nr:hypothetical protein [Spirochaetia bacterium]